MDGSYGKVDSTPRLELTAGGVFYMEVRHTSVHSLRSRLVLNSQPQYSLYYAVQAQFVSQG